MKKSSKIVSVLMSIVIMAAMSVQIFASEASEPTVKDNGDVLTEAPIGGILTTSISDFREGDYQENLPETLTLSMDESEMNSWIEKIENGDILPYSTDHIEHMESHNVVSAKKADVVSVQNYIIDENGNKIVSDETLSAEYSNCDHNYVLGSYIRHYLFSDNSCLTEVYDANRCSDCGTIWILEMQSSTTSRVCRH